jgi:hypothetical protein
MRHDPSTALSPRLLPQSTRVSYSISLVIDLQELGDDLARTGSDTGRSALLFIPLDDRSRVLWLAPPGTTLLHAWPSPDGRHLAINGYRPQANVSMMTNS